MVQIVRTIMHMNPQLRRELRIAHMPYSAEEFVKKSVFMASMVAGVFAILTFLLMSKSLKFKVVPAMVMVFCLSFALLLFMNLQSPKGTIRKREKEINREVLFSGRYLLVKMESGTPLFNSLIDASRSFNVSAKYFREIVDEINTGTPIEVALENAREYNASPKFKKVLWQILASLKTGTEVTGSLRSALKTIANEQMIEIKEYGKKLNSLMLFYMVVACIMPSLGVALFIIVASFINLAIAKTHIFAALFGLFIVQFFFIMMINSARPAVEL